MPSESSGPVATGALGLQCRPVLRDAAQVSDIADIEYTVSRADMDFRTGSFLIDGRGQGYSAVIGELPAANDYRIRLHSRLRGGKVAENRDCTGNGSFSVAAGETTVVAVDLRCGDLAEHDDSLNKCPRIDAVRALPSETVVGGTISLRADAHDADRKLMPLSFTWVARGGTLLNADQPQAAFTCTALGMSSITLKITDGDASCREESISIQVPCRAGAMAGSVAANGGSGGAGSQGTTPTCDASMAPVAGSGGSSGAPAINVGWIATGCVTAAGSGGAR